MENNIIFFNKDDDNYMNKFDEFYNKYNKSINLQKQVERGAPLNTNRELLKVPQTRVSFYYLLNNQNDTIISVLTYTVNDDYVKIHAYASERGSGKILITRFLNDFIIKNNINKICLDPPSHTKVEQFYNSILLDGISFNKKQFCWYKTTSRRSTSRDRTISKTRDRSRSPRSYTRDKGMGKTKSRKSKITRRRKTKSRRHRN